MISTHIFLMNVWIRAWKEKTPQHNHRPRICRTWPSQIYSKCPLFNKVVYSVFHWFIWFCRYPHAIKLVPWRSRGPRLYKPSDLDCNNFVYTESQRIAFISLSSLNLVHKIPHISPQSYRNICLLIPPPAAFRRLH